MDLDLESGKKDLNMTKTPHECSSSNGEPHSFRPHSVSSTLQQRHPNTNYGRETEGDKTCGPMSCGDILKIAALSRKYGPLFYQDPFVMETLKCPMIKLMVAPRNGRKDNLCLISGVTADTEQKINQLGIWHYDQIISMTEVDILWFENKMNFEKGFVQNKDWKRQCQKFQLGMPYLNRLKEEVQR